jgi:sulfatase maturation enzyme AslB (radical SAM superfamily)
MECYTINTEGPFTFIMGRDGAFFVALDNRYGNWKIVSGLCSPEKKREVIALLQQHGAPAARADDYMEIVIFITDNCNLACVYCKYAELTQTATACKTDIDAILHSLGKLVVDKRRIAVTFQGGEPLLRHRDLFRICAFLTGTFPEIRFSFSLQSNGTVVNEEVLHLLTTYHITVGVTIDGEQQFHDLARPFKNGAGSFSTILDNLRLFQDRGVCYGVLSVIREPELLMKLFRFNHEELKLRSFYLKPLEFVDFDAEGTASFTSYYSRLADRQLALLREIINLYKTRGEIIREQMLLTSLGKLLYPSVYNDGCSQTPFCGSNGKYKSINSDGTVEWCAHLRGVRDVALKQQTKERYGMCAACPISSICLSFCPTTIPGYHHGIIDQKFNGFSKLYCFYRRQMIFGMFDLLHEDMSAVLGYFQ